MYAGAAAAYSDADGEGQKEERHEEKADAHTPLSRKGSLQTETLRIGSNLRDLRAGQAGLESTQRTLEQMQSRTELQRRRYEKEIERDRLREQWERQTGRRWLPEKEEGHEDEEEEEKKEKEVREEERQQKEGGPSEEQPRRRRTSKYGEQEELQRVLRAAYLTPDIKEVERRKRVKPRRGKSLAWRKKPERKLTFGERFNYPHRYSKRHEPRREDWYGRTFSRRLDDFLFRLVLRFSLTLSFLSLLSVTGLLITLAAVGSALLFHYLELDSEMPLTFISVGIVFPISFGINFSLNRRERALLQMASLKSSAISLYQFYRQWALETLRQEEEQDTIFLEQARITRLDRELRILKKDLGIEDSDQQESQEDKNNSEKVKEGIKCTRELEQLESKVSNDDLEIKKKIEEKKGGRQRTLFEDDDGAETNDRDFKSRAVKEHKAFSEEQREVQTVESEHMKRILVRLFKEIKRYLAHEAGRVSLFLIYRYFDKLWHLILNMHTRNPWPDSLISRVLQYHRFMMVDFESLKVIHDYRIVSTLRGYGLIFLSITPVCLGPLVHLSFFFCLLSF
ncbi:hypothetical protein QOT17_024801 [Balamuthia mandrillaris]